MKLIVCIQCADVVALREKERTCACGKSSGYYLKDGINAVIDGPCIPIGFANRSFVEALQNQPHNGWGEEFKAFVIPKQCDSVRRKDD